MIFADRVKETSTTSGTGPYTLNGAKPGFQTFLAGLGSGSVCHYCATDDESWEVGVGTVSAGTLSRDRIVASSNSDNPVSWTSASRDVFCTASEEAWEQVQTRRLTQTTHGFVPGTPVYLSGSTWAAAQATADGSKWCLGLVSKAVDANTFILTPAGLLELSTAAWDTVAGTTGGLTAGADYFLSDTAGALAATPASERFLVGTALSPTVLLVLARDLENFTQTAHNSSDHSGVPGIPAPEAFTQAVHDALDHTAALPLTTKGDLLGHTGATVARRAVGTPGQVLTADPADSVGFVWANPTGGGGSALATEDVVAGVGGPNLLTAGETEKILFNTSATEDVYNTLPGDAGPLRFGLVQSHPSWKIRATAQAGETIRMGSVVSAASGYVESTSQGDSITLVKLNATEWVVSNAIGVWDVV